tara:strand:- start:29 stop:1000 length:972 start_codon:yes stop_codon:yes gene_type:complete
MKNRIILVSGDPNSINSEIIYKSWKRLKKSLKKRIFVISNTRLLTQQFKKLKYPMKVVEIKDINQRIKGNSLKVLNVDVAFRNPFKVNKKNSSKFIINCLNYAHKLALNNNSIGIVNCPINKNLLKKNKIGVTEFLAKKCNIRKDSEVMLIYNKKLSVSPVTTHIDLKDVSKKINVPLIVNKVIKINSWYLRNFKKKPKIGILGLNPHNAELRKYSEEKKKIIPAILKLKKLKINAFGPLVTDTIFMNLEDYDVIVGMYHDQVLTPFKTIFKFNAINITLGLKYFRASPDHGTAISLIGKNKANYFSLLNSINFLNSFKNEVC